jgi:hypothetical protein
VGYSVTLSAIIWKQYLPEKKKKWKQYFIHKKKLDKDLLPISNHMGPTNSMSLFFFKYYSSVYLEAFEIVFHLISFFVLHLLAN